MCAYVAKNKDTVMNLVTWKHIEFTEKLGTQYIPFVMFKMRCVVVEKEGVGAAYHVLQTGLMQVLDGDDTSGIVCILSACKAGFCICT